MKSNISNYIYPLMDKLLLNNLKCISTNIDIDTYLECCQLVKTSMENPEWLGDFTKEDLIFLLGHGSKIWLYYLDNDFVCSMMAIPSDEKGLNNLGLTNYDYKMVVDYGPMMVNPKYIGYGLQYQMLKELDIYTIDSGYNYAASTIHPANIYSINNFIKDGFTLVGQKNLKRGLRNIYLKKVR